MPPAAYPDFRWFFRTLRVLPVVAVAALAGGIIGGWLYKTLGADRFPKPDIEGE